MKRAAIIFFALLPLLAMAQLPLLLDRPAARLVGVPPNQSYTGYFNDIANFYGDSITAGYLLTNTTNRFSSLLSAQYYMIESNYGVGGSQIADSGESDLITSNNAVSDNTVSVWFAGYNDMRYYGTNAAALADNLAALESLAAWLAIPTSLRVPYNATANFPQPNNIYYSQNQWSFAPGTLGGLAYSGAAGALAGFYFSGSTLLIGTARGGGGGNATIVVGDYVNTVFTPTQTNTFSCLRTSTSTAANRSYSPALIVITNLSANTNHGCLFSAQSGASIYLCWFAGYTNNLQPKVVLSGSLKMPSFEYQNPSLAPNVNGSDAAADQYSGILSNTASILATARLNVKWVPAPVLNTNTDFESDYVHPNESGHLKIKNAIQTAF